VRLLTTAAALLCALLALPATASGRPRAPFDFELGPTSALSAAGGGVVSQPLATARRFNLVGLRWRGRAAPSVSVRVRRPGRGWSRWQGLKAHSDHAPDPGTGERSRRSTDPLWVGSANAVQYRLGRRVAGLRLHFVNVAGELAKARSRARARAAQDPEPDFVTRGEWGASKCPPRTAPSYGSVSSVHVHHTVSLNDYAPEDGPAIVLSICRFHRNSNGWNDIGYNALVDKYGVLYEGRAGGLDQPVLGAHAQGFNSVTAGIASIADHTSAEPTPETLDALARYIRWKLQVHGQPLLGKVTLTSGGGAASRYPAGAKVSLERVIGHRDTGATACPGGLLYARLGELRSLVANGTVGVPTSATRLSAILAAFSIDFGETVPLSGILLGPGPGPLPNEVVEVQTNGDGFWKTSAHATTGADGSFTAELRPRKRIYVRMRYPGRTGLRRTTSPRLLLGVRALISLRAPATTGEPGERVPVAGTVAPRKRFVRLVLQQRIRGRYRKVSAKAVRVRKGRVSTSFVPASAGSYRYAVIAVNDLDTDRGSTGWQPLRVR
jgi:hypothetical protein